MFDFKKLISSDYLFKIDTVMLHRSDKLFLIIGAVLLAVGIIMLLTSRFSVNPFSKVYWRRLSTLSFTIGLLELLWFAFRFENIRGFGSHIVAILILLAGVIWKVFILKYRLFHYRDDLESWDKEQLKQKYINMNK